MRMWLVCLAQRLQSMQNAIAWLMTYSFAFVACSVDINFSSWSKIMHGNLPRHILATLESLRASNFPSTKNAHVERPRTWIHASPSLCQCSHDMTPSCLADELQPLADFEVYRRRCCAPCSVQACQDVYCMCPSFPTARVRCLNSQPFHLTSKSWIAVSLTYMSVHLIMYPFLSLVSAFTVNKSFSNVYNRPVNWFS